MLDPQMFYMDPLRVQITGIHIMDMLFEYIKERRPWMSEEEIDDVLLMTQIGFNSDGSVDIINSKLVEEGWLDFTDFKDYYMKRTRERSKKIMEERLQELRN